jgi:molybdenum cofactor cytidylyltransferase
LVGVAQVILGTLVLGAADGVAASGGPTWWKVDTHELDTARACAFDQLLCVIGGGSGEVRAGVEFEGVTVVENEVFGEGCSSSIAVALTAVAPRCDVLILMLGDQPGVTATVGALLAGRRDAPLAACGYADSRGHPPVFARSTFEALASLRGDKGVWKLMDRAGEQVVDVPVAGPILRDVDTWEDYEAVLGEAGLGPAGANVDDIDTEDGTDEAAPRSARYMSQPSR